MVKKFDALAEVLARKAVLKVEIRRLRRQAREEVRAMKKAGAKIIDENTLELHIRDDDWLLQKQNNIRQAIREQAKINVGNNIMINYGEYTEARKNWLLYNQSVEAWNARHEAEIKAGTLERRYKKPWSIAKSVDDSQEDVQSWIDNLRKNFASPSDYFRGLWGTYVTNVLKSIRRKTPVGMDWIIDFFEKELPLHIPKSGDDYQDIITDYYVTSRTNLFEGFRKYAEHYGLGQQWHDLMLEHKAEVDNYVDWI